MTDVVEQEKSLREKFALLGDWIIEIIHPIKKDLRQDHLAQDRVFANKYFRGKTLNKITNEEFVKVYSHAVQQEEKGEQIAEFLFHRWLMKNTDVYYMFDRELSKITEDYTTLKSIDRETSQKIKDKAIEQFGPEKVYLFCLLNGVVFDHETMDEIAHKANETRQKNLKEGEERKTQHEKDAEVRNQEAEIARLKNKYEDKLAGLEKKYERDVSALKKQVAQLQRNLQNKS
ncbi:MAG: hypothetical protein WC222_09775 [Parachlamydiales bacterium]|jgi:hypothetical protein